MELEESFPFRKEKRNYLNTCGLGVTPKEVIDDLAENYLSLAKNPHIEFEFEKDIEIYKQEIRKLIGQTNENMSFLRNVTEGLVIAAQAIPFKRYDEIIVTNMDHRTALNCWYLRQLHNPELELKIRIAEIPINATHQQIIENIFNQVTERTKVICIPHIDRYFGILFPVEEVCKKAKSRDIITIVDGAQAVGLTNVNLERIDCDIYLSCLHKWYLSPLSIGTISVHSRIFPFLIRSYAAASRWYEEKVENRQFGGKELGTRNVAVEKSLGSLIKFHEKRALCSNESNFNVKNKLINGLKNIKDVEIAPVIDLLGNYGVVVFKVKNLDSNSIINILEKQYNISVGLTSRSVGDMVRVSIYFYNKEEDIQQFLRALEEIIYENKK